MAVRKGQLPSPRPHIPIQVSSRIDPDADDDLAMAIQRLMRSLGSGTDTDGGGLHVLLAEDSGSGSGTEGALLDAARMTDASGRAVPAPPDMVPLLLAVNSAAGRLAAALSAGGRREAGEDGEDGGEDGDGGDGSIGPASLSLQVGCILEPAMLVGSGRRRQASPSSLGTGTNPPSPAAASLSMQGSGGGGYLCGADEGDRGGGLVLGVSRQYVGDQQQLISGEGVQVRELLQAILPASHCPQRLGCAVSVLPVSSVCGNIARPLQPPMKTPRKCNI